MTVSLGAILYPYGAFLAIFVIGVLVNVWHMVKFGTFGGRNVLAMGIFLAGTAVILWGTWWLLQGVGWGQPLVDAVPPSLF